MVILAIAKTFFQQAFSEKDYLPITQGIKPSIPFKKDSRERFWKASRTIPNRNAPSTD
jgi:hypothetical protein